MTNNKFYTNMPLLLYQISFVASLRYIVNIIQYKK